MLDKSITLVGQDRDTTIIDGNGSGPVLGVEANNVTIANFTVRNAGYGTGPEADACIGFERTQIQHVTIENNILTNSAWGIAFGGASSLNITNNIISDTGWIAIDIGASWGMQNRNVTISNNLVQDSWFGINLDGDSQYCSVINNTVQNSFTGIDLGSNVDTLTVPSNNLITGNTLSNNSENLLVESQQGNFQGTYTNTFSNNNLTNTQYHNLVVWGYDLACFMQDIDSSNTVNNKKIYYLTNESSLQMEPDNYPDAGYVALVNSVNVTLEDMNFSGNNDGLLLAGSTDCTLTNITMSNNHVGAIFPTNEAFPNNYGGLDFFESDNNTVTNSNFSNDSYGVGLYHSDGNLFYHNSFVNNDRDVISDYLNPFQNTSSEYFSTNTWDNGLEGNYWSQYNGTDFFSGTYQNVTGSDGIGDKPYIIDANNTDNYPLMGQFSDFNAAQGIDVQAISNSTISDFQFNGTALLFDVTGENGTTGFCRISIPITLINGTLTVFVNGTELPYTLLPESNSTESILYFTYHHSTEPVVVAPEFPTFIPLPFLMITTLIAIVFYKKKKAPCKKL
jgi:parallel beta-helix repeat protein